MVHVLDTRQQRARRPIVPTGYKNRTTEREELYPHPASLGRGFRDRGHLFVLQRRSLQYGLTRRHFLGFLAGRSRCKILLLDRLRRGGIDGAGGGNSRTLDGGSVLELFNGGQGLMPG